MLHRGTLMYLNVTYMYLYVYLSVVFPPRVWNFFLLFLLSVRQLKFWYMCDNKLFKKNKVTINKKEKRIVIVAC